LLFLSQHLNSNKLTKNVIIYQRDTSRILVNSNEVARYLSTALNKPLTVTDRGINIETVSTVPNWTVMELLHSSAHRSTPCELVRTISAATVLITPHGFQSILLLFQPLSSLLVEIHPAFYVKPEVYGNINAGLHKYMHLHRLYLYEESLIVPTSDIKNSILHMLSYTKLITASSCLANPACRFIARQSNIKMSKDFMNRTVNFILKHFS
jgi:hypothetical protein